jgi:hypothetical protein
MLRPTAVLSAALLSLQLAIPAARAHAQAAAPFPVVPTETRSEGHHVWAYLTLAGGATLVGLSFMFSNRADHAYDEYLASTDPEEIDVLYDSAVHNDHLAQASLLTGEAFLATGLYLRFIRHPAPKRVSLALTSSRCALAWHF